MATGATTGYAAGEQTNTSPVDYAQEVTYNTPPGGTYQRLRMTGESLSVQDSTSAPDEINDLPEAAETVLTGRSTSGSLNGVLSYGTYDDFLAGILGADWFSATFTSTSTNTIRPNYNNPANKSGMIMINGTDGGFVASLPNQGIVTVVDTAKGLNYSTFYYSKSGTTLYIGPDFLTHMMLLMGF